MDLISRITKIQRSLRELVDDLEALKSDFVGETAPVKSDLQHLGVLNQMKDLILERGIKKQHG
jgi:hypothetical protein